MRSALGNLQKLLPELTALREATRERLRQEQALEAAELEEQVTMATMLFNEAVSSTFGSTGRDERIRLIATLALRGKEEGAEAALAASVGKHVFPGDDVDDTEAIVLAMDSPDDIDAALPNDATDATGASALPPAISLDVVEAMMQALALTRLPVPPPPASHIFQQHLWSLSAQIIHDIINVTLTDP